MNRPPSEPIEQRLERAARAFPYPATPSLAAAARAPRRRGVAIPRRPMLAAAAALLVLLVLLLAVPAVRAAVRSWLIGVIEVIPTAPAEPPGGSSGSDNVSPPPGAPQASPRAPDRAAVTPTPGAAASDLTPTVEPEVLRGLVGPTSLEDARRRFRLPIRLPGYPAGLGPPDRVYLQDLDGNAAILVWLDPEDRSRVRLGLHLLTSPAFGRKTDVPPENARETSVGGRRALWIDAPHLLEVYNARGDRDIALRRLVDGNVLIWEQDGVTYRLETELPLDEAVRVAESLE